MLYIGHETIVEEKIPLQEQKSGNNLFFLGTVGHGYCSQVSLKFIMGCKSSLQNNYLEFTCDDKTGFKA